MVSSPTYNSICHVTVRGARVPSEASTPGKPWHWPLEAYKSHSIRTEKVSGEKVLVFTEATFQNQSTPTGLTEHSSTFNSRSQRNPDISRAASGHPRCYHLQPGLSGSYTDEKISNGSVGMPAITRSISDDQIHGESNNESDSVSAWSQYCCTPVGCGIGGEGCLASGPGSTMSRTPCAWKCSA